MRAHYLQHVHFEGLGAIEPWLATAGYTITHTAFYASDKLPKPEDIDFLVVMGGPMSVNDEAQYPWLNLEKHFIAEVIAAGKPVLGICLGAQLIAAASGAPVYANNVKEIGWFPVEGISSENPKAFRFPPATDAFHWHGETFDLPTGATHLARSAGCENQAFQLGSAVIGLQFHVETTIDSARQLVTNCSDELAEGSYIQGAEEILAAPVEKYQSAHQLMAEILLFLHNQVKIT
jgi:GMP synthase-like glutamine amidotransferase